MVQMCLVKSMWYLTHYHLFTTSFSGDIVNGLSYFFSTVLHRLVLDIVTTCREHGNVTFVDIFQTTLDIPGSSARVHITDSVMIFAMVEKWANASDDGAAYNRHWHRIGILGTCRTSGSGDVRQLVVSMWQPVCCWWEVGDFSRWHTCECFKPIAGRYCRAAATRTGAGRWRHWPSAEASLIVSMSSLLFFSKLRTFWRSLLFSNWRRPISSFWELSVFLLISRARTRSVICACIFTMAAGMLRQFSQVQTPTYSLSSPTQ